MDAEATDLWQLVYVSSATQLLTEHDLAELLEWSRQRNAARSLTGLLAYHDGNFMQALEGPRDEVLRLADTIGRDPRHRSMITLLSAPIPSRQFGEWSMAFRHLREAPLPEGFSGLLSDGFDADALAVSPGRVRRLLQTFADTQLRRRASS